MTTLDTTDALAVPHRKPGLFVNLYAAIERNFKRRARHRTLVSLAGYEAHLLRDMGIDPRDVEDALNERTVSLLFQPLRR